MSNSAADCHNCGTDGATGLCPTCAEELAWERELAALTAQQDAAAIAGRAAEAAGKPVIYAHGRPYEDPSATDGDDTPAQIVNEINAGLLRTSAKERNFPWNLWDGNSD